jgi:preprotein translocase subunit SecA
VAASTREPVEHGTWPHLHHEQSPARAPLSTEATSTTSSRRQRSSSSTSSPAALMPGRRWSDGLHQAVEAKEGMTIQPENQTLASITFQNYFRLYDKLSGMTGTATPRRRSSSKIYGSTSSVIPTNRPWSATTRRPGLPVRGREVRRHHRGHPGLREAGQPVLVGTASIEKSERLHASSKARHPARGAQRQAARARGGHRRPAGGRAVTIATNMAGRGTDIVLGGNWTRNSRPRATRPSASRTPATGRRHARSSRPAACTSSAPSATSRGASTTSCAGAPGARAIRARRASTCR